MMSNQEELSKENEKLKEVISTQKELLNLLEIQVVDLTMMSKIELGDDVIQEILRLKKKLDQK